MGEQKTGQEEGQDCWWVSHSSGGPSCIPCISDRTLGTCKLNIPRLFLYCLEQEERITKSEVGSPGDLISHFVSSGASFLSFSASLFSQLLGPRKGQHWVICRDMAEPRDCHIE